MALKKSTETSLSKPLLQTLVHTRDRTTTEWRENLPLLVTLFKEDRSTLFRKLDSARSKGISKGRIHATLTYIKSHVALEHFSTAKKLAKDSLYGEHADEWSQEMRDAMAKDMREAATMIESAKPKKGFKDWAKEGAKTRVKRKGKAMKADQAQGGDKGGSTSDDIEDSPSRQLRREHLESLQRKDDSIFDEALVVEVEGQETRLDLSPPHLSLVDKLDRVISATDQTASLNAFARRLRSGQKRKMQGLPRLDPAIREWLMSKLGGD